MQGLSLQLNKLWWETEMRADPVSAAAPQWGKKKSASGLLLLVLRVIFHQNFGEATQASTMFY